MAQTKVSEMMMMMLGEFFLHLCWRDFEKVELTEGRVCVYVLPARFQALARSRSLCGSDDVLNYSVRVSASLYQLAPRCCSILTRGRFRCSAER